MSLTQALPTVTDTVTESLPSSNSKFTCIACQMAFSSSDNQRAHYRTDWHKYNLKRKMADLDPVTSYQFNEKVLAQQARIQEEFNQNEAIYHCDTCRKSYGSQSSYESHIRSKKHKEAGKREDPSPQHDSTTDTLMETDKIDHTNAAPSLCLFCDEQQYDFDANLRHMSKYHGFFLPDSEYLSDVEGLINYLSNKIRCDLACLYCHKGFKTSQATMAHMMDKGHCKMAYDDTEDPEALLKYYDFGPDTSDTEAPSETKNGELQLLSGTRLGNRHFLKSYKRQHHRSTAEEQHRVDGQGADDQGASGSDPSMVVSRQQEHPESLAKNRKERRHPHLAITDGQVEQQKNMTLGGIHEAALKHAYQSSVGVKQNAINTFRFRTQNPI